MPLVPPDLDQRTFDQLVTEIRRRIPTFTPEWTDLNDSDPGITLAQLFAFMSEQLLFQINQVPEKGLITFLRMVGAELHPAAPAVADVTFVPRDSALAEPFIVLVRGTRVETSGPPPGAQTAISFETVTDLQVLNGELVDLVTQDASLEFASLKASNDALNQTFVPFGERPSTAEPFFLVFSLFTTNPDPSWPEGRFRLRVNVAGSKDVGNPPPPEVPLGIEPRIVWEFCDAFAGDGLTLSFAAIEPSEDSTLDLTRNGYLEFDFSAELAQAFKRIPDTFENDLFAGFFVMRARLARAGAYDDVGAPRLHSIRLNTVPANAVETVRDEPLGSSTGLPFQRLRLARQPVVRGSTVIQVNERSESGTGDNFQTWTEIEDLFTAGPSDRVYQLFPATGEILFGDGNFGKIPPPDDDATAEGNIAALEYRFGGGAAGNVGVETLTNVFPRDGETLPVDFSATNVLPAAGGADEEPVSEGVARAPAVVRSRFRAVSAQDFEALARETPLVRVARALALPNTRPGFKAGSCPGAVTVVLVPFVRFEDSIQSPIPVPTHVANAVLRFLDQRRLVTTELFTSSAVFRQVTIRATVVAEPRVSIAVVRTAAIDALNRFFHALLGGPDGTGWPFGGTIFFSRVFETLLNVSGVARAEEVTITVDGVRAPPCDDFRINPGELLFSGQHEVVVEASA